MKNIFTILMLAFFLAGCDLTPKTTPAILPTQTTNPPTPTISHNSEKISLGYYTGSVASMQAVKSFVGMYNTLSVDVYGLSSKAEITGTDPQDLLTFAKAHAIPTYLCISNYNNSPAVSGFDPTLAYTATVTYKEEFIPALVERASAGGYSGVNIDFENIAASPDLDSDRTAFTAFIQELSQALHSEGLKLIISVPAKTAENPNDDWSYPFDLAALGRSADYLQLMTYDAHGPWSEPGPVSGADWVENVVVYTSSLVDPAKLLIGLPAYGYDWRSDGSTTDVSWVDFSALLSKPDVETDVEADSSSPWLSYTENGITHTVWYENTASLQAKAALVEEYSLGGLSMWALGKEDAAFWQAALQK